MVEGNAFQRPGAVELALRLKHMFFRPIRHDPAGFFTPADQYHTRQQQFDAAGPAE